MLARLEMNKHAFIAIAVIAAVYSFSLIIGYPIGCLIELITEIECPTCGMTSALYHALRGDFSTAFYFHPLFPLPIIVAVLLFVDNIVLEKKSKLIKIILILIMIIVIGVYILRITGVIEGFVPLNTTPRFF